MSAGGEEYRLTSGRYTAAITQVGAGVRELRSDDRDLILSYAAGAVRPRFRGALLVPWPNRVVDGRYSFAGRRYQLDLSEPERLHALHGLVTFERFAPLETTASAVTLRHQLVPRTGYPFALEVLVRYELSGSGLRCAVTTRNVGAEPAPYGVGPHPYVVAGTRPLDSWSLDLPAGQVLEVEPDRLIPLRLAPVADAGFDFRGGRRIGGTQVDHAFTALTADPDGLVRVRVLADDGTGVECSWDPGVLPWVQVHTADLPDRDATRLGLAVEPMTCPPDAFNSGTDLVVLEPGEAHTAEWRLGAVTPGAARGWSDRPATAG